MACYPIPEEVAGKLMDGKRDMSGFHNIRSEVDGRTYCVRCYLWRPSEIETKCHHCNICQRCVTGFDHHCGVFGRCIVAKNMPCFILLVAMLFVGMVLTGASFVLSPTEVPGPFEEPHAQPIRQHNNFLSAEMPTTPPELQPQQTMSQWQPGTGTLTTSFEAALPP